MNDYPINQIAKDRTLPNSDSLRDSEFSKSRRVNIPAHPPFGEQPILPVEGIL